MAVDDYVLTVKDVMRELNVSRQSLWEWRKLGSPPDYKQCPRTRKIRYSASSVLAAKQSMNGE